MTNEQELLQEARVALDNLRVHYNRGWEKCTVHDTHEAFLYAHRSGKIASCVAALRGMHHSEF